MKRKHRIEISGDGSSKTATPYKNGIKLGRRDPDSRPHFDPAVPPRCDFESFFATSDPQSVGCQRLRWYPRVQEITAKTQERAQRLAHESKSTQKVIPLRRRSFPVVNDPDYAAPRWLNPDFAQLTRNRSNAKSRVGSITFSDMERLERTSRTVVGGFSQSYWLLSSLLSQLKQDGFQPSEPALFDKTIQSLSSSMALQTSLVSGMTDFIVSKRRESFSLPCFCSIVRSSEMRAPGCLRIWRLSF